VEGGTPNWAAAAFTPVPSFLTASMAPSIASLLQYIRGLLGVPNPNHCVAIVPKLQDLVQLQHQVSQILG